MLMMGIHRAGQAKFMAGEALLDVLHHHVDAIAAVTAHEGVEIACFVGPGSRDEIAPAFGIRFVPNGEIALIRLFRSLIVWLLEIIVFRNGTKAVYVLNDPRKPAARRLRAG
jgi:hypothetical protein